jgi:hypothetical protein
VPAAFREIDRPLWRLQIPYVARYNYREEMVVGSGRTSRNPVTEKLVAAYGRIAVHLAALAGEGTRIHEVFAGEISAALPHLSKTAPQMAPPISDTWVERPQEVEHLIRVLLERGRSEQTSRVAVWGFAGSGKTSLVARVCRHSDIMQAYPDGVLWATVDRPWTSTTQEWLRKAFGIGARVGESGLLQAVAGRRYLLVVDDVWDLGDTAELFRFGDRCTQLVVTRDHALAARFAGGVVSVGPLNGDQASRILGTGEIPLADDSERAELVRHFVRWPLGATLLRAAFDRRLAQGDTADGAWEVLREHFRRFGITAFDQFGAVSRSRLGSLSLEETASRLKATDRTQSVAQSLR